MPRLRFDQLRISTTLADSGLESYTDGTGGTDSIRVATGAGLTRDATGVLVDGSAASFKTPVRVRATGNITLATPGASIDGVALNAGDRVLLDQQTTPSQDGLYTWNGAATLMTRTADAPVGGEAAGWYIPVLEGSTYVDSLWRVDADFNGATIGTDGWTVVESGGGSAAILAGAGLVPNGAAIDVNTGDGISVTADRVVAQVSTAVGAQQYGGLTRTRSADGSGAGTADQGYLAVATDNSTIQVTASNLVGVPNSGITETQLASTVAGGGLTGGAGTALAVGAGTGITVNANDVAVDPDSETGGNIQPVNLTANGVGLDVNAIAGTGLAADGAANLQIDTASTVTFSGAVWTFPTDELQITGTPNSANDVANKGYVDSVATGLDPKDSVNTATTTILAANASISGTPTYSPLAGTSGRGQITATLAVSDTFTIDGVTYSATEDGSRVLIKEESTGVAEVSSVDTVADTAGSLNNTYFVFYTTPNFGFYVWYNASAAGTDPTPAPPAGVTYAGIEVAILNGDTADTVATNTKSAIDAFGFTNTGGSPVVGISTNQLTITNAEGGNVTDVADGAAPTGFTFGTDTQGTGLGGAANGIWTTTVLATSLTLDRAADFEADNEVTAGAYMFIEEGSTNADSGWVLLTNDPITLGGAAGTPLHFTQFTGGGTITAGIGLTQSGTTVNLGSALGDVGGISRTADDIAIAAGDGIVVVSNQTAVQAAVSSALQQYGGIVVGRTSNGASAASPGDGFLAVQTDNSTLGVNASNQVFVQASGIGTTQLADDSVTMAKVGFSFREEEFSAASFALSSGNYVVSLANTAIATAKTYGFNECYRNGIADLTNTGATDPATATEYRVTTAELQIGADITGTGDIYRVRYLSTATT